MPQQGAALTQPTAGAITHAAPVMPQQGAALTQPTAGAITHAAACGVIDVTNDNCKDPTSKDKYCKCIGTAGYPNCDCPTDAMGKQVCEGIKTAVTSLGCPAPVMPQQGAALTQPTAGAITHAAPVMPQQGAALTQPTA